VLAFHGDTRISSPTEQACSCMNPLGVLTQIRFAGEVYVADLKQSHVADDHVLVVLGSNWHGICFHSTIASCQEDSATG
jgi:hypothetical protein